jgi:hypothetical protein
MLLKRNSQKTYLLLWLLFLCVPVMANTRIVCDSIISNGVEAFNKRDYIKSLEFFTEARSMANKNNWDRQLYEATFHIGNTYYAMLDYGEALNYFLDSYTIALKKLDIKDEIASLNNIANLYTKEKIYDKALEYYYKAYELAKDKNIDARKGLPGMNIGYIYNRMNEPKKARPYIIESMLYLKDEYLLSAKILLVENDILLGHTSLGRKKSLELLKDSANSKTENLDVFLWSLIAKSYLEDNDYNMAAEFALKVLGKTPDIDVKRDTYQLLSDIYNKSGDLNRVIAYKDSIIASEKKLNDIKNGRVFENNRVKFEIQGYKEQLNEKEENMAHERRIFYAVIAVILVIVLITMLMLRQKRIIAERNQHISELDLEKEKNNNLLLENRVTDALLEQERLKVEEERLKNEVESRNKKIFAKALYLSDRNELIEEIVTYLSKKPKFARDQTLANYVMSLKEDLKTNNEWDSFIKHFEEVNYGLLTRLKTAHPELTVNDIRFISYMHMNLSPKEIASILNITIQACKKRKERLSTKMNLAKDVDLYSYILAF